MNVLVTGGGTSAPIDDVRSITNVSTGRFAAAISESCLARGACVWHLHAPSAQVPLLRQAWFDLRMRRPRRGIRSAARSARGVDRGSRSAPLGPPEVRNGR